MYYVFRFINGLCWAILLISATYTLPAGILNLQEDFWIFNGLPTVMILLGTLGFVFAARYFFAHCGKHPLNLENFAKVNGIGLLAYGVVIGLFLLTRVIMLVYVLLSYGQLHDYFARAMLISTVQCLILLGGGWYILRMLKVPERQAEA